MFDLNDQSPQGNLVRMLRFTAAIMIFTAIVQVVNQPPVALSEYINTVGFMFIVFGGSSYLSAYLIDQKNSLAYMPILIASLYPLSVSLTTGQGLNIILILFGVYILFRIWRLNQANYFEP